MSTRRAALSTALFWKNAFLRALRTSIVIVMPYLAGHLIIDVPWLAAASAAGLGFVLSIATSLAGLVEASGAQVTWWFAITERITKTAAQALVAAIGTAVLLQDVDWAFALQSAAAAAFGSLLLGFLTKLPEAPTLPSSVQPTRSVPVLEVATARGDTLTLPAESVPAER